jgi:aspartate aminotransferase-like enzyme
MNLITLIEKKDMSSSLTTFILPKNIHIDDLKAKLRERNIIIYNGKGLLAGKVFQVANIGNLNEYDVAYFLKSMEAALIDLGHFGLLNKNNIHTMNIHAPEDSLLRESKKVNVDNFYTTSQ